MTARKLTESEFNTTAGSAFREVFASADPFNAPFTEGVERRAILYPVGYELLEDEFTSLTDAASVLGDSEVYVSRFEEVGQPHYVVPFDYEAYASFSKGGQNALYGPSGSWGLILSHEDHGVVGGPTAFFEHLHEHYPPAEPFHPPGEQ